MSTIVELIVRLGALVIDNVTALGNFVLFLTTALWCAITPPYKPRLTIRQMRSIGAESVVLVALIGAFTGMVLGLQGYNTLRRFGSEGALGTVGALVLAGGLGDGGGAGIDAGDRANRRAGRDGDKSDPVPGFTARDRRSDQFPVADGHVRRDRNLGRLPYRSGSDGRARRQLPQRYRAELERPRHHERPVQGAGLRTGGDVGLLLQGLSRTTDGDRGEPRHHRGGGAFQRADPRVGLFPHVDSPIESAVRENFER